MRRRREGRPGRLRPEEAPVDIAVMLLGLGCCHLACKEGTQVSRCLLAKVKGSGWTGVERNIPQEASNHVLEQANCLDLDQPTYHVAEDGADSVETFIRGANIAQAGVV